MVEALNSIITRSEGGSAEDPSDSVPFDPTWGGLFDVGDAAGGSETGAPGDADPAV